MLHILQRGLVDKIPGKQLINNLVESGFKLFDFQLYADKGKDEKHVVCEENDYFYGMYADTWDFNSTLKCIL